MNRRIQQKISVALKMLLLSCSLPLLLTSSAWAQECTEERIKASITRFNNEYWEVYDPVTQCGSKSVKPLVELLKNKNEDARVPINAADVRINAADALGSIGPEAKAAVPILIELLKNKNEAAEVRSSAADALGRIGPEAKAAVPVLVEVLKDKNEAAEVRSSASSTLGSIGPEAKAAVPVLVEVLKDKNEAAEVRSNAADALGRIGPEAKAAVPILVEVFKDKNEAAEVRSNAANALRRIGPEAKAAVPVLVEVFKDKNEAAEVRADASSTLGRFGLEAKAAVPVLVEVLKDKSEAVELRINAADALELISLGLQTNKDQLGTSDLGQLIQELDEALNVLDTDHETFEQRQIDSIHGHLENLKQEKQSRLFEQISRIWGVGWLVHILFWLGLISVYPKSSQVQAIFFWNPKMRRFLGLGYVGLALTWIPFLRSKLFAPFRESLLSDANLDNFDSQAYFADLEVKLTGVTSTQPVQAVIPAIRGQIVLEGESGLGKSMFLRNLVKSSQQIVVYLPAKKCAHGVMEAIQAKLHGPAKDPDFLQNLIYSGAIDICIDGLNEVTPDTRAKVTGFVESYFKGNIVMATQPLEWMPPSTANTYILQPLKRQQIEQFLVSRQPILPQDAPVIGQNYEQACREYLIVALNELQLEEELVAMRRILSNPMDLTVVAQMLARKEKPNLLNLQQQQYEIMAAEYERMHLNQPFPLAAFAEMVYQMRLRDQVTIPAAEWLDELQCMERYKMVLSRQFEDAEGKLTKEWYFRHDKIQEFFIVQTFLGEENEKPNKHISDPRFRGVYFLLATLLPLDAALQLRETLIRYAANTKDHTVSDKFIQLLLSRQVTDVSGEASTINATAGDHL